MILHAMVLGVLSLMVVVQQSEPQSHAIDSRIVQTRTDQISELIDTEINFDQAPISGASGSESFLSDVTHAAVDSRPHVQTDNAAQLELSPTGSATASLNQEVTVYDSGSGANGDDGTSTGGGFFGLDLNGQSIVFVVDGSRSMNHPHPGPSKTRFGRVKMELLKTIATMTEDQQFFMIFFNENAYPMPANQLIDATPDSKKQYLTWMANLKADGNTDPHRALLLALQLKPDIIYFLTDGNFDFRVVPDVRAANLSGVVIHTIGFGDDRGAPFLMQIAKENSGRYKFIPEPKISGTQTAITNLKLKSQSN